MLVVGAGPSGLSAAYHLTRLGHSVTIKDVGAEPGGMMRYGIPKYRLPRDILDAEITRVLDMGVTLELAATVTDLLAELTEGGGNFDAAFVAVGAHIGKRAYIPAGDSAKIMDAVSLLHRIEDGSPPMLGRRVAVYGGGNTAMTRRAPRVGLARPRPSSSTAAPGTGCPRTTSRWKRRWRKASRCAGCPRSRTPATASW